MATVVLGAQWGDEGKGKLSDILCGEAELCCRGTYLNCTANTFISLHLIPLSAVPLAS